MLAQKGQVGETSYLGEKGYRYICITPLNYSYCIILSALHAKPTEGETFNMPTFYTQVGWACECADVDLHS